MAWNFQQFGQTPNVIGNPRFHRGGHAQAPVNTAKVVVGKVQCHGSFEIVELARKCQRQSCESGDLESHGQVLAFHEASRDVARIRISASDLGYNLRDSWWGVPLIPELAVIAIQLSELSEIGISAESGFNSFSTKDVRICSQLNSMIGNAAAKIKHECLGVFAGTLTNNERGNQLCVRIKRHIYPLITKVCGIILSDVLPC